MIVQESAQGMTQAKGARKCQQHLTHPQQDDRISTRKSIDQRHVLWSHNIIRPKYTRYLKTAQGEASYINRLRDFLANLLANQQP